jgi:hypothetical protein
MTFFFFLSLRFRRDGKVNLKRHLYYLDFTLGRAREGPVALTQPMRLLRIRSTESPASSFGQSQVTDPPPS